MRQRNGCVRFVRSNGSGDKENDEVDTAGRFEGLQDKDPQIIVSYVDMPNGHREKVFQCVFCSRHFSKQYLLKRHFPVHTGERPFKCLVCGDTFSRSSTLARHEVIHRGSTPFICNICGKSFNRSSALSAHKKTHESTKEHICTICGKGFHQKGNLQNHIHTHTQEKPFPCQHCDAKFKQLGNLNCHIASKHQGQQKSYTCKLCNTSFTKRRELRHHEVIAHHSTIHRKIQTKTCAKQLSHSLVPQSSSMQSTGIEKSTDATPDDSTSTPTESQPEPLMPCSHQSSSGTIHKPAQNNPEDTSKEKVVLQNQELSWQNISINKKHPLPVSCQIEAPTKVMPESECSTTNQQLIQKKPRLALINDGAIAKTPVCQDTSLPGESTNSMGIPEISTQNLPVSFPKTTTSVSCGAIIQDKAIPHQPELLTHGDSTKANPAVVDNDIQENIKIIGRNSAGTILGSMLHNGKNVLVSVKVLREEDEGGMLNSDTAAANGHHINNPTTTTTEPLKTASLAVSKDIVRNNIDITRKVVKDNVTSDKSDISDWSSTMNITVDGASHIQNDSNNVNAHRSGSCHGNRDNKDESDSLTPIHDINSVAEDGPTVEVTSDVPSFVNNLLLLSQTAINHMQDFSHEMQSDPDNTTDSSVLTKPMSTSLTATKPPTKQAYIPRRCHKLSLPPQNTASKTTKPRMLNMFTPESVDKPIQYIFDKPNPTKNATKPPTSKRRTDKSSSSGLKQEHMKTLRMYVPKGVPPERLTGSTHSQTAQLLSPELISLEMQSASRQPLPICQRSHPSKTNHTGSVATNLGSMAHLSASNRIRELATSKNHNHSTTHQARNNNSTSHEDPNAAPTGNAPVAIAQATAAGAVPVHVKKTVNTSYNAPVPVLLNLPQNQTVFLINTELR